MTSEHLNLEPATNGTPDFDFVIVGAGFGGLYSLYHLRQQGYRCRVYDMASGVGGTWHWNRYPGSRVDIEAIEYSYSFSEELQQEWEWSERYASQPELLRYINHVADRFDLRRDIQLETRIESARYHETSNSWIVSTSRGETVRSRFCILATGVLSVPNTPTIAGFEKFAGRVYHTAHWPEEPIDFTGLRVGVIGTGSSGVQVIQEVAKEAGKLVVFQRTASFVAPLQNGPMTPEYARFVKANYAKWRRMQWESFSGIVAVDFTPRKAETRFAMEVTPEERRAEYEFRWKSGGLCFYTSFPDVIFNQEANDTLAEFFRRKIREKVTDPAVAEALTPHGYPILAKRLCCDSGYYEAFNRDNVTLVDTTATPIEEITPAGIVVDGTEHELDALILATGFDAVTGPLFRMDIRGVGGLQLRDHWAQGPRTHLGLMTKGFPNLFFINGPHSPQAFFVPVLLGQYQTEWINRLVGYLREHGAARVEPTAEAETAWTAHVSYVTNQTLFPKANSWYLGANIPGKPRVPMLYLGGFVEYSRRLRQAEDNAYDEFVLAAHTAVSAAS